MIEVRRYTAEAADETRSIVLMLGRNKDLIPVNSGPAYSPIKDPLRYYFAQAVVIRTGLILPGAVASIVTLTGNPGDTWLMELALGTQGSASLIRWEPGTPTPLDYGVGVLCVLGSLLTGDVVQIGAVYERPR